MEVIWGSCRFGLWFVNVCWNDAAVHRVRFATTGIDGPVPPLIRQFCAGKPVDLSVLESPSLDQGGVHSRIYHAVRAIPYGMTATYGVIARQTRTIPRVVGQAMAHNPVPLVIPCHRIVGAHGIGGFTPSVEIKEALLAMERRGMRAGFGKEILTKEGAEYLGTDPR